MRHPQHLSSEWMFDIRNEVTTHLKATIPPGPFQLETWEREASGRNGASTPGSLHSTGWAFHEKSRQPNGRRLCRTSSDHQVPYSEGSTVPAGAFLILPDLMQFVHTRTRRFEPSSS
jgi:hypothetical protein